MYFLPKILIMSGQKFQLSSSHTLIFFEVENVGYLLCKTLLKRDRTFSAKLIFSANFSNPFKNPALSKSYTIICTCNKQAKCIHRLNYSIAQLKLDTRFRSLACVYRFYLSLGSMIACFLRVTRVVFTNLTRDWWKPSLHTSLLTSPAEEIQEQD